MGWDFDKIASCVLSLAMIDTINAGAGGCWRKILYFSQDSSFNPWVGKVNVIRMTKFLERKIYFARPLSTVPSKPKQTFFRIQLLMFFARLRISKVVI